MRQLHRRGWYGALPHLETGLFMEGVSMQLTIRRQIAHALFLSLALPACGADAVGVDTPEDVSAVGAAVTSASTVKASWSTWTWPARSRSSRTGPTSSMRRP